MGGGGNNPLGAAGRDERGRRGETLSTFQAFRGAWGGGVTFAWRYMDGCMNVGCKASMNPFPSLIGWGLIRMMRIDKD